MYKTKLSAILLLIWLMNSRGTTAQVFTGAAAEQKINGAQILRINQQRNTVDFVKLLPNIIVAEENHIEWIASHVTNTGGEYLLDAVNTTHDKYGFTHYRYRELYKNLPVEGGCYSAHFWNQRLESISGEFYSNINLNPIPSITKSTAYKNARNYVNAVKYKDENDRPLLNNSDQLVVLPMNGNFFLAYKIDIYSEVPLSRKYIYVDAHNGKILFEINRIVDGNSIGTAVTGFSGTQTITTDSLSPTSFRLRETARGNGINTWNLNNGTNYASATDFTDADNYWSSATLDKYAYDAHFGAEKTYDFYFNTFGRNSYDNAGTAINSYVHYSSGYVNAFWDGTQMTYGDGDGVDYYPLTSVEIVGHEITHAVTETSAGLIYSGESGALNESFSDIFGNTIRFITNPSATWYIGDEIVIPGGTGTPFRNMANPNQFQCADTYGGTWWNNGDIVHYDSGVQNFWYYLLSAGGTGVNDLGNTYTVTGIGLADAAAIAFRNLTVYLTPNSTFADARFYAIQAATDLFGSCSNQVIQTTNAWYAVGVGGLFSNAVVAGFTSSNNYFCVLPATVNFINNSINATTYLWDFGDTTTSTLASPSHLYANAGVYTVTLIATGTALCGNTDTMTLTNYITVTNGGGPVSNACSPSTVSYCCNAGITNVQFGSINKTSPDASEGYKDFTCGTATTLVAGNPVPISVTSSFTTYENVKAYIDYNNNGSFDPVTELVFASPNKLNQHTGIVNTSVNAVLNTPLRLRVMDDNISAPAFGPCTNLQDGQAEDYTITFIANTLPPVVDFIASDTVINVGGSIVFTDLTMNAPSSWQWNFPGGTPASSTTQNPAIVYNTLGTYPVTLIATNGFGSDSLTKTMYIHVVNSINMCTGITTTVAPNGQLYDSGGPSGNYQNGENCSLLIDPGCALSVTLTFSQFASESGYDYLRVYNGTNAAAPLLLTANGTSLPPTVTANSGKMFITWISDGSVVYNGWAAQWTSVVGPGLPPFAAFNVASNPPVAWPVQFTDQTTNLPLTWSWDFGDGQGSTLQNPSHTYSTPGAKTVTLIAGNCITSDTTVQIINIQQTPAISVSPDSISVSIGCNDSITVPLTIYNTGSGDLIFQANLIGNGNALDTAVLVIQENNAWGLNMAAYLLTNYGIVATVITSAQIAVTDFSVYDVIITTGNQSASYYSALSANQLKFETFVLNGGIVQYQLAQMSGTMAATIAGGAINTFGNNQNTNTGLMLSHPVLAGLTNPLNGNNANHCTISNIPAGADIISETATGNLPTTVAYDLGFGKVLVTGMCWEHGYMNSYNSGAMMGNALNYHFSLLGSGSGWITLSSYTDTILPGDSTIVYVTINSTGLNAGNYNGQIVINSNDTANSPLVVTVNMQVSGPAEIALSDTCIHFGSVMQYTNKYDTITITNNGCDTLHITSAAINNPAFSVSPAAIDIAPLDSGKISIEFNPQTPGIYNGILTLLNNANDTTICLDGSCFLAPQIAFNPDSISVNIGCGDSLIVPLYVINTGGDTLFFNIGGASQSATVKVLAMLYGVDLATEYANLINGINQNFTNYILDTTYTTIPSTLQVQLTDKDVLLMPEQETGTSLSNTAFAPVLQSFVAGGGTVIICGSNYSTTANKIYDYGLFTGSFQNYITGTATIAVSDTTDDLMDGLPQNFTSTNATFYHTITNGDKMQLVSYQGFDVVTYRNIGLGKAIYMGFDYFNSNIQINRIAANAIRYANSGSIPPWVFVNPVSGSVLSGDSLLINLTFNSYGYIAGTYNSSMLVFSNDPLHSPDTIPLTMIVSGNAEINLSDTCFDFGQVMQYTTVYDTLVIHNSGCDTLHISSASVSNAAFGVTPVVLDVPPYTNDTLYLSFNPQTPGIFNGLLTLLNNANDTTICLTGISTLAPVISVVPDSISASIAACGDSLTVPFYIHNVGGDSLVFSVSGIGSSNTRRVLAMLQGADLTTEYPNLINGINQYYTNYTLDTTYTTSAIVLQTLLANKDILLFPEQESGVSLSDVSFAPLIQSFITAGGTVISCGSAYSNSANKFYDFGLFTGNFITSITGGTLTVSDTTDDLMDGVPLSFNATNATFYHNVTNGDKIELVSYNGSDVVTYRNIGNGKAIYIGFDYYNSSNEINRIAANAIRYAAFGSLPSWITVTPATGTVFAGDSILMYATFNSTGLTGGTHTGYILINSNDPLLPVDSIAVSLSVSFDPCADFQFVVNGCTGIVNFTDATFNGATSWYWNFGDGDSSFVQNPTHTYSAPGTYNVQLIVCNATSCDTITYLVNIPNIGGPLPPTCTPLTTAYCCGVGIANVLFNTINNSSSDASEGFRDFSCTVSTSVFAGNPYTLTVTTGTQYSEDVRAWIDYNNDGIFSVASEQVFVSNNLMTTHTGTVLIPLTAVLNTPLRMRVSSEYYTYTSPTPCTNLQRGQAEDYTVTILPNTNPPLANFSSNVINTCTGIVQFTDLSQNFPTSWQWNFGDGGSSTSQNPLHQYTSGGTFNVTLIATNLYGSDTIISTVTVIVLNGNFTVSGLLQVGQNLQFTPVTTNATSYMWNFGDGFLSTLQNPLHIYTAPGIYIVSLFITSGPCNVTVYDTLTILQVGINEIDGVGLLNCSPNPFNKELQIHYNLLNALPVTITISDMRGRLVKEIENNTIQKPGWYSYSFSEVNSGTYFIRFKFGIAECTYRIVKTE